MIEHDDPAREGLGLVEPMGRHEDRAAARGMSPENCPKGSPSFDVEAGGRLVEEHCFRAARKRKSEGETSFLATGQSPCLPSFEIG